MPSHPVHSFQRRMPRKRRGQEEGSGAKGGEQAFKSLNIRTRHWRREVIQESRGGWEKGGRLVNRRVGKLDKIPSSGAGKKSRYEVKNKEPQQLREEGKNYRHGDTVGGEEDSESGEGL